MISKKGIISYYGVDPEKEKLNIKTASGEIFSAKRMTCALPRSVAVELGIYRRWGDVKIKYQGKSIIVRYNDTGPNERLGRIADMTPVAFSYLESLKKGLIEAEVEVV